MTDTIADIEARLKELKTKAVNEVATLNPRWTSSRLWIVVGAIVGLVVLKRLGLDIGELTHDIVLLVVVLVLSRTLTDISRDWCGAFRYWARQKRDSND